MFDFAERRAICLEGMKKAYKVGLFGDGAEGPTDGKSFQGAMMGNGASSEKERRQCKVDRMLARKMMERWRRRELRLLRQGARARGEMKTVLKQVRGKALRVCWINMWLKEARNKS
jgi:hypothetical protein